MKAKDMRFSENISFKKQNNSNLYIVKNEIYIPKKNIVLLNNISEEEKVFFEKTIYKGGTCIWITL